MADDHERIRGFSHGRQLLGKAGSGLPRILRAVIGVYSAHPSGPLSLAARAKSFTPRAFARLDADRKAVRAPAMRQTVYMLPAGTARIVAAATIPPPDDPYWAKRYANPKRGLPKKQYKAMRARILKRATRPMTLPELRDALDAPEAGLKSALNRMAFEGVLLRVGDANLRANAVRYVATKSWIPDHAKAQPADIEPLSWLAGEYLRAFGPARVKDFQWWAGITASEAKEAIAGHETVEVGDKLLLRRGDLRAFGAASPPTNVLDVLPPWDCYTMGYAPDGRGRFVDRGVQGRLYGKIGATTGNALGAVLVDGRAVGAWTCRFKGDAMAVSLDFFERPPARQKKRLDAEFAAIAEMLGASNLDVTG